MVETEASIAVDNLEVEQEVQEEDQAALVHLVDDFVFVALDASNFVEQLLLLVQHYFSQISKNCLLYWKKSTKIWYYYLFSQIIHKLSTRTYNGYMMTVAFMFAFWMHFIAQIDSICYKELSVKIIIKSILTLTVYVPVNHYLLIWILEVLHQVLPLN